MKLLRIKIPVFIMILGCFGISIDSALSQAVLNISSPTITEGNSGTKILTFQITCNPCQRVNAIIDWATADGTATVANNDYVANSGRIDNFGLGTAMETYTANVTINGDTDFEPDETLELRITNASVGLPSLDVNTPGIGTILNDDGMNQPPDCTGAAIADQSAGANCQATISGADVTGVTDPDMDMLTITVNPTTLNLGANNVTVMADDGNGGICSQPITVNVVDNTDPVITCPANITQNNDAGQCGANVNFPAVVVTDNCDNSVTVVCNPPSGSFFDVGTTTVTCTATDDAGNTDVCTFTVTVNDTEAPQITCPANITVGNDPGQCGAVVNYTPPVGTDNCLNPLTIPDPNNIGPGGFFPVGVTTETFAVIDAAGLAAMCSFTVTVNDTEDPTITCPPNQTVECIAAIPPCDLTAPTTMDNCPGETVTNCADVTVGDDCGGTVTRTYTVTDVAGNTNTCDQVFTIVPPVPTWVNPPGNLQLPCNVLPQPSDLNWTRGTGVCNTIGTVTSTIIGTVGPCEGSVTERWEYTDVCGAMIMHERLVFYKIDTEAPVLSGLPDPWISIPCGSDLPAWPNVTSFDNCDGNLPVTRKQEKIGSKCGTDRYIRSWRSVDECGNAVSFIQSIRFMDTEPPVLIVPEDTIIHCDGTVPAPDIISYDACSWHEVTFSEKRTTHNSCEYTLVRTWKAKDGCNNWITKTQTIEVVDNEAPVIEVVNPDIKEIGFGGEMVTYHCDAPQVSASDIKISDCCADASYETYDKLVAISACDELGVYQKWRCGYIATDGAGNQSEYYFYVMQYDTVAPELHNVPSDTTIACGDSIPALDLTLVSATDNCNVKTWPEIHELYYYDPADSSNLAILRSWYAEDACGNSTHAYQLITVCDFDTTLLTTDTTQVVEPEDSTEQIETDEEVEVVDTNTQSGIAETGDVVDNNPFSIGGQSNAIELNVYPNPAYHELNIQFTIPVESTGRIKIVDKLGRTMKLDQRRFTKGTHSESIDIQHLPSGVYWILLETSHGIQQKRVVKAE